MKDMDSSLIAASPLLIRNGVVALSNGNVNKLLPIDAPIHRWYRFVLSYPPQLVRHYLGKFDMDSDGVVLDPFCGTGTTLVEAKKNGIKSIGVEANPIAHFASSVKTSWNASSSEMLEDSAQIAARLKKRLGKQGIDDQLDCSRKSLELRGLPSDSAKLILRNSISSVPLHKTLLLLEEIERFESRVTRHLKLAITRAIVSDIGNLHFGPEVGVGRIKSDAEVIGPWLKNIAQMAADIEEVRESPRVACKVINADSRNIVNLLEPESVDAVITSPPYPNEKDYSRTTRLEGVLLGFTRSKDELRAVKRSLLRSNTRGVYKNDSDDAWIADMPEIQKIANEIEARRISMGKDSGFERMYPRVTKLYFGGMAKHLADLRRVLRPGARLAYVVGDQASYLQVLIQTGTLLAMIAEKLGYKVLSLDLFRTRLATATKQQLREEVVVLRWPG